MTLAEILAAARDAGIAITALITLRAVIVSVVSYFGSASKGSSDQWREVVATLRETNTTFQAVNATLLKMPDAVDAKLDTRFDALENMVTELSTDVKRLIALVAEDKASG